MPARLVYAPKAWVYTKDSSGNLYNLSNYVTAGTVTRLINQASTASVTLRNPGRVFTTPGTDGGGSAFHPMDPITIYLERLARYPVRVFTGYLDDAPYWQMYPGTITLNATCTLKRLLYTWFDPSLPEVISFLQQYGWTNTGQGSIFSSSAYNQEPVGVTQADVANGAQAFGTLQDGSFSKLLWATLYNFGDWEDSNIYIEALPAGLPARVANLIADIDTGETDAADDLQAFLGSLAGTGSQGSGGGSTDANIGNVQGLDKIIPAIVAIADSYGIPPAMAITTAMIESGLGTNMHTAGSSYYGWYQMSLAPAVPYSIVGGTYTQAQTYDLGTSCNAFCAAAAAQNVADKTLSQTNSVELAPYLMWAEVTQGVAASVAAGGNQGYPDNWASYYAQALQYMSQYGGNAPNQSVKQVAGAPVTSTPSNPSGSTTNQAGATGSATGQKKAVTGAQITVYAAIVKAANTISKANYPYELGGGHPQLGVPSPNNSGGTTVGFDCSGSVSAVLGAAGLITTTTGPSTASILSALGSNVQPGIGNGADLVTMWLKVAEPDAHVFLDIGGNYFGTSDGNGGNSAQSNDGAGWLPATDAPDTTSGAFTPYHIDPTVLQNKITYSYTLTGGPGGGDTAGSNAGSAASDMVGAANAQAFVDSITYPSIEDQITALALGSEHKGLMHDQSLMPFVQQLAAGSCRSFMSLPNGDFYAFYPDYFGEFGQHDPYWLIDDIEITDGGIGLSDAPLVTHAFVVGDNTWPINSELMNDLFSSGAVTIFDAFLDSDLIDNPSLPKGTADGLGGVIRQNEAVDFIKRYGARPLVSQYPMLRSSIMEMLFAYQTFMQAWAAQFMTPYAFTFMPELFPGGKVAFPKHGLQMYIESVTHSWDLAEAGFTTTAQLSSPSIMAGASDAQRADLPPLMVRGLVEPVATPKKPATSNESGTRTNQQANVTGSVSAKTPGTNAAVTGSTSPVPQTGAGGPTGTTGKSTALGNTSS